MLAVGIILIGRLPPMSARVEPHWLGLTPDRIRNRLTTLLLMVIWISDHPRDSQHHWWHSWLCILSVIHQVISSSGLSRQRDEHVCPVSWLMWGAHFCLAWIHTDVGLHNVPTPMHGSRISIAVDGWKALPGKSFVIKFSLLWCFTVACVFCKLENN